MPNNLLDIICDASNSKIYSTSSMILLVSLTTIHTTNPRKHFSEKQKQFLEKQLSKNYFTTSTQTRAQETHSQKLWMIFLTPVTIQTILVQYSICSIQIQRRKPSNTTNHPSQGLGPIADIRRRQRYKLPPNNIQTPRKK